MGKFFYGILPAQKKFRGIFKSDSSDKITRILPGNRTDFSVEL